MNIRHLPFRNLIKKPLRTTALLTIAAFLVFAMFGGSITILSIRRGIDNLQARLGADVIVVPDEAKEKNDFESILIDGTPGYFYMDKSYLDQVASMEGVDWISPQYYLASSAASCCSEPLQIIGFDPETDFFIQPWIDERYKKELDEFDVVVGSGVTIPVGGSLRIYDEECTIVAKLDNTGTGLDKSVYMTGDTVKKLIDAAKNKGFNILSEGTPDDVISTVYVKLKDGYSADTFSNQINFHMDGVQAIKTKNMLIGISDGLAGISGTITSLIAVVWIMSLVIMLIAFSMLINERKKEFAILRTIGMSRGMLAKIILSESASISIIGGVIGILLSCLIVFPFSTLIEAKIGLPFLLPDVPQILFLIVASLIVSVVIGSLSSAYAAFRLSRVDAGLTLRGGE